MNIQEARKQLANFTSEAINGLVNFHEVMKFCIDFSNLIQRKKMSPSFFASFSALYFWFPKDIKEQIEGMNDFTEIAYDYLDKMQPDKPFEFVKGE